jgi:hypothetical protein
MIVTCRCMFLETKSGEGEGGGNKAGFKAPFVDSLSVGYL